MHPRHLLFICLATFPLFAASARADSTGNATAVTATSVTALNSGVVTTSASNSTTATTPSSANTTTTMTTAKNPIVVMETSQGTVEMEIFADKAPISAANFLQYVDSGYYNGTIFHRVIPSFMIQGGGFTADFSKKPTLPPIKNEAGNGLTNDNGTLAMARTSVVDSATSQFFINTKDNAFLNHTDNSPQGYGYAVFGKVVSGMDVVKKIEVVPTSVNDQGMSDVPVTVVLIKSIKRK
jgi:cyclophilin family peptidyl-prolyl cis-trans isomerase